MWAPQWAAKRLQNKNPKILEAKPTNALMYYISSLKRGIWSSKPENGQIEAYAGFNKGETVIFF